MKKFKRILVCLWMGMLCVPVFAQYDAHLTGHVLDERTGEHLPFVNVQVKGTNIGTVTDESGHYFLRDMPIGKQTIVFSYVGYETLELPVTMVEDKTIELKATIREVSQQLNSVVVTANRYATKRQETATIVNVLSPDLFQTTAVSCVADVLSFQPGLRVENSCSNCGKTDLRINGLQGQYTQILMDSRPVFSSMASVYGLEQVPAAMIDRIEVVRGGGSAVYGANAIAGVVNIITKEPVRNFVNISNVSNINEHAGYDINTELNASVMSENRKIGAYLFAAHRSRSPYDRDEDGFSEVPKLRSTTAGARVFFKTSAYSKITAEYHHTTDFRRGGNRIDDEPHTADIAEQLRHNIDAGSLAFDWYSADNRHFISAYSALQHIGRESYFGTERDTAAYGRSKDLTSNTGLQYRFSYPCGRMKGDLTVGAEYNYNGLNDRMLGYHRELNQKVHVVGVYAQNEWKNDQWSVLVGARLEKHNLLTKPVCTPRATFRYTPVEGLVLRAGYSSGYRAPQAYDEDLHVAAVGGNVSLITLDPNLKPEYSHSATLSADWYHQWGKWELNLTAEGFYTYLQDVFFLREDGIDPAGNILFTRTNAPGAWVGGLNVEGKLVYGQWFTFQIGYTFQQSRYTVAQQWSADVPAQKRMLHTPDNYGYVLLDVHPVKDFTISINGKATGSMLVPHLAGYIAQDEETLTPSFWDLGIRLAYDVHLYKHYCLEISCGVKNVLDQFQKDLDKGPYRDAGYIYGPSIPRTYFAGLALKL
ncbi:MAG: TonB-dependent receptor [Bacteroidales bacterium]|nr:TonB-dependent receptor [Bacteroidales bacterium]MDY6406048.1 TonB-dependent receptor [Bacteroidales bacterium]